MGSLISLYIFLLLSKLGHPTGQNLSVAYNRKMTKAGEACRKAGMVFIPMPMETLGGWHEQTVLQVKKLASAQARHTGGDQSETTRHLSQRLSIRTIFQRQL